MLPKGGIGKLDKRVAIQSATWTRGDGGGETAVWADDGPEVWASVEPLSGNELVQAQQIQADARFRVVLRYQAGVTTQKRVRFGTRYLNIGGAQNFEEKGEYLTLLCAEYQQ